MLNVHQGESPMNIPFVFYRLDFTMLLALLEVAVPAGLLLLSR
jgi:hypothetical protein